MVTQATIEELLEAVFPMLYMPNVGGCYQAAICEDRILDICCSTVICRVCSSVRLLHFPEVTSYESVIVLLRIADTLGATL
jgi:hypothetical protein